MKVLVTGPNGFIGKNLVLRMLELGEFEVLKFVRGQSYDELKDLVAKADAIVHLAGENRPADDQKFIDVNAGLTEQVCRFIISTGKSIPILLASSSQAELDNPYGRSKLAGERALEEMSSKLTNPVSIYRLPGVFGKWCKPNYNSVVATFCYNKAHDLPVLINDNNTSIRLVYVDDVVKSFIKQLRSSWTGIVRPCVMPEYNVTLADLSDQIDAFKNCRTSLISERVGGGFARALYATYISYLPINKLAYSLTANKDKRGVFVEMLKTQDTGQFSYFTAHPGITRGGHYHHTKTEKFLVIKGRARFGFRHMITNEVHYIETVGEDPKVVETVPGWAHDITNIGNEEMLVMLWANEIFDLDNPDTIPSKV